MHRNNKKIWSSILCFLLIGALFFEAICQQRGQGVFVYATAESEQQTEPEGTGKEPSLSEVTDTEALSVESKDTEKDQNNKPGENSTESPAGNETQSSGQNTEKESTETAEKDSKVTD